MARFVAVLDKYLTRVLMTMVVAMTVSISAEIVLNAAVQPVVSRLIIKLAPDGSSAAAQQNPGGLLGRLQGINDFVSVMSAPLNTISQSLLVWLGILGSALAFRFRAHLGVDALVRYYPRRVQLILDHISTLLVATFSLTVLVIGGWLAAKPFFDSGALMPGLEWFNRGWFFLVLSIAGVLNLIYAVHHFLHPMAVSDLVVTDEPSSAAAAPQTRDEAGT